MLSLGIDVAEIQRWLDWVAERSAAVKKVRSYIKNIAITPDGKLQVAIDYFRFLPDKIVSVKPELTEKGTIKFLPDRISAMALWFFRDKLQNFGMIKNSGNWEFDYEQLRKNQPQLPEISIAELTLADSKLHLGITLKSIY